MEQSSDLLNLFTRFTIPANPIINPDSRVLFCGSCFSQNIGYFMEQSGFKTMINPFGIVFNPVSIAKSLERIAKQEEYNATELVFNNGTFHSLDHHGSFYHSDAGVLLNSINADIIEAHSFIKTADVAILTPGTAWSWQHLESGKIVANCHKLPSAAFDKVLLSETEVFNAYTMACIRLKEINNNIKIIFTISPVKHLRDGVVGNAASKARLISALHRFLLGEVGKDCSYFPAYEIMTEELRDHRFYTEDLAHPTPWSTEYIYKRFKSTCFTPRSLEYCSMTEAMVRMQNHKQKTNDPAVLENWVKKINSNLETIAQNFPEADLSVFNG